MEKEHSVPEECSSCSLSPQYECVGGTTHSGTKACFSVKSIS